MPVIIQYLLKLSLSVAVIHAFYYLMLRRLTFYNLNRWYLAGYTVLCFVIPFINVAQIADRADEKLPVLTYIPSVQNIRSYIPSGIGQTAQHSWTIWDGIIALLAIGSAILIIRLIVQMASFIRLKQRAEVLSDNGAVIYHIDEQVMPFSFGNSIYLNKNSHTDKELEEIIMHEYVHVKQMHSVDILIAELFCVINWYNPFAWFMRHSIRQNLEFIADDNVVRSGINKKDYQYHLLKVVGIPQYSIANQFNFSSLKKRIIMMNQQRSAKIHLLKFMFILPLLAVTLLAFRSEIANAIIKVKHMPITIKFMNTANTLRSKPVQAVVTKTKQATANPQITDDGQMKFTSLDSAVVDNVKQFITLFGHAKLSNATGGIEAPIIMADKNKDDGEIDFKNALVELDGKMVDIGAIDLNKITSVNVMRSKMAIAQFGEKGKYGALLYSTQKATIPVTVGLQSNKNGGSHATLTDNGFSTGYQTGKVTAFSGGEVIKTVKIYDTYLLIVKHDDMFDAYSNLALVNVKKGDKVNKGQVIGAANFDANGKSKLIYDFYKGDKFMGGNDTTRTTTTTTIKGNRNGPPGTYTTTIYGAGSPQNTTLSSDLTWSTNNSGANGLTTTSVLPDNTLGGPKGMLSGVAIYDSDDLVSTIDPQHIEKSQLEAIKKEFTDNGFEFKITADIKDGKARKLRISISGSRKDNSSSSDYAADDITNKDKILIKIRANKKTGLVSIDSTSEDADTK